MKDAEQLRIIRESVYIEPEEVFLWTGKPALFRLIRRQLIYEQKQGDLNFGCTFLLLLGAMILLSRFPFSGLENIPLPFILLLILIVISLTYFAYKYHLAKQIIYAITNRRILVLESSADGRQVLAYNNINELQRRNLQNGKGDLVFAKEIYTVPRKAGPPNKYWREIGFIGVENVAEVEALLRRTFPSKK